VPWTDKGRGPERILAMKIVDGEILRSLPICAYPAVAKYDGNGDINDATNFACATD
jgi:feruloyl esterase